MFVLLNDGQTSRSCRYEITLCWLAICCRGFGRDWCHPVIYNSAMLDSTVRNIKYHTSWNQFVSDVTRPQISFRRPDILRLQLLALKYRNSTAFRLRPCYRSSYSDWAAGSTIRGLSLGTATYVGHLESKERLRIQPAQLFNFSWWVMWCVQ